MKKTRTALLALLLCLGLALPAFAEEIEPTPTPAVTEPTPEPEPETTPEPEVIPEPEPTPGVTTEPTTEITPEPSPAEEIAPLSADAPAPVYSVNITWGATEFTYREAGTWNPKTLSYEDAGAWSPASGAVTVDNNSNVPVIAAFAASIDSAVTGIGSVGITPGSLERALAAAESTDFIFSLTGAPDAGFTGGVIGTLTVTITAPEGETP